MARSVGVLLWLTSRSSATSGSSCHLHLPDVVGIQTDVFVREESLTTRSVHSFALEGSRKDNEEQANHRLREGISVRGEEKLEEERVGRGEGGRRKAGTLRLTGSSGL